MIEFKNVSMKYKTNNAVALDKVNVRINDGEFVFIVGASGAGKSSFLNVIMGQEKVDSGEVIVGSYNLQKIKKRELPYLRRMLGIVFQDFRLIPKMTVYDNVAFALRVIGMGERKITKRVRYVLKLVDLSSKAKNFPHQLSQGERQRVAIARALVNNPAVIIADEPTGNLDPVLSGEIMSLFDKINALGATVVVVTHDLELVRQFDHRIVTIENGSIVSDIPARSAHTLEEAEEEAAGDFGEEASDAEPEDDYPDEQNEAAYEDDDSDEAVPEEAQTEQADLEETDDDCLDDVNFDEIKESMQEE